MEESKATRHNSQISKVRCSQYKKAKRYNSQITKIRCCQTGGQLNDIILKIRKSDVVNRCCEFRKPTRHSQQRQNSYGISGGKQNDIILKFPKSDAVKVDESQTTYFFNFTNQMLSIDVVNRRKPNDIIRKFQK